MIHPLFIPTRFRGLGNQVHLFSAVRYGLAVLTCLVLMSPALGLDNGNERIVDQTSTAEFDSISFRNAYEKITNVVVLRPANANSSNRFSISSTEPNPQASFAAAVSAISQSGQPGEIIFDGGTYEFDQLFSNHFLLVNNCNDLRIRGNGSTLIFNSASNGFGIYNSHRVSLIGFKLKYRLRVASTGVVRNFELGGKVQKVIELDAAYQEQIEGNPDYRKVSSVYEKGTRYPFNHNAQVRWLSSSNNGSFSYNENHHLYVPSTPLNLEKFPLGKPVLIKHYEYRANSFNIQNCSHVGIENCTASNVPGMFLYARKINSGLLVGGNRLVRDSSDPLSVVSASNDGVHLQSADDNVIIRHNLFSFHGDDGVNLHSEYWKVNTVVAPNEFVIVNSMTPDVIFPVGSGRALEFNSPGLRFLKRAMISSSSRAGAGNRYRVTMNTDLPQLKVGDLVNVEKWQPKKFVIIGNTMRDHWGRGMLIQSRNGLITENRLRNIAGAGIVCTTDNSFFGESGATKNLVVSDNEIFRTASSLLSQARSQLEMGAVSITARADFSEVDSPNGYSKSYIHRKLVFECNSIDNVSGPAFFVSSARDILIDRNTMTRLNRIPYSANSPGSVLGVKTKSPDQSGYGDAILDFYSKNLEVRN